MPGIPNPNSAAAFIRAHGHEWEGLGASAAADACRAAYPDCGHTAASLRTAIDRWRKEGKAGAGKVAALKPAPAPPPTPEEALGYDRTARRLQGLLNAEKAKLKAAIAELDLADKRLDAALGIVAVPTGVVTIEPARSKADGEATAVVLLSDWHIGERVDLAMLDGLNEYTPEIATRTAHNIFQNIVRLVRKEREAVAVDNLVLWLGGDFITGWIHDELIESNHLSPTEETALAKQLLHAGIQFLLKHGGFERLTIVCNPGNHGRTTAKMHIATSHRNSYEWMMYNDLRRLFDGEKRITWNIPTSPFAYVQVYDKVLRFMHGEAVKYGGGIGGLAIPLIKYVQRLNKQHHADLTCLGHFHQYISPTPDIRVNGSAIGLSAYAQKIGCTPEPPQQSFFLIDKRHGFTVQCPIRCR